MSMRPVEELINRDEPAIGIIREWVENASNQCELLPPSIEREQCLHQTQVTTRSPMGAMVYDTGGLLVDHGWLRILGSGHPKLARSLPAFNKETLGDDRSLFLIADDALGGFFALNGGALGPDHGNVYYLSYDGLKWEPVDCGYSAFLFWALTGNLADFYGPDRWEGWREDLKTLHSYQCFSFYPFLWSAEGSVTKSRRMALSARECWAVKQDIIKQLGA